MNIYEKLLSVRKSCPYLRKDNKGHQYQYVSSSQALGSLRRAMDETGLILVPSIVRAERNERTTAKGGKEEFTELWMEFRWINSDKPEESVVCPWYAQGVDTGEKGVGKALTYGEKYFLLKFFNIATDSDDPDRFQEKHNIAPAPAPDPTPISAGDRKSLEGSIGNLNLDRERVKEFAARVYGKFRFAELTRDEYLDLSKKLGAMAKRAKEEIEAPAGRFGAMKKSLSEYLSTNRLMADVEAIAEKGLSAAMGEFGDWPDAANHGKFFAALQAAMDSATPCQCRACDADAMIGVAKESGWKRESPPKPGFPVWACPACQVPK